jgi:hypothetical protein
MNERHEQLMAQAWIEFAPDAKAVTKRFAELIVRECCQFEKSYGGDAGLIARDYSRKIKEHFGVEE